MRTLPRLFSTALLAAAWLQTSPRTAAQLGWDTYGGDPSGQRYSASRQITRTNISQVKALWTYHTGALALPRLGRSAASFESTPVLFRNQLLLTTPFDEVISLDPQTGKQNWRFDPKPVLVGEGNLTTSRGVAVWSDGGSQPCANRVFVGTLDGFVAAADALTGKPCTGFGQQGRVNLKGDVGWKIYEAYAVTSPPVVVGNVLVVGSSIPDSQRVQEMRGTVHAFDAVSGKLLWTWDPIATWADRQPPGQRTGAGNVWSAMSADPKLGLVYLPTGSASPDHFGGTRPGDNRDANSVVALDAKTGRRVWGFQLVHHDIWDYDVATEPLLFDYKGTPALAVAAKLGAVFILDRRTGVPLVPVDERPVPKSDVPGESASPTQPFSRMPTMGPTNLGDPGTDFQGDAARQQECADLFRGKRYDGVYTPPSLQGTLEYPGSIGGVNWGGLAYDPTQQILYANANSDVYGIELITRAEYARRFGARTRAEKRIDALYDFSGHRKRLLIAGAVLVLLGLVAARRSRLLAVPLVLAGTALLLLVAVHPWLGQLADQRLRSLPHYGTNGSRLDDYSPQTGTPYWMHRKPLADSKGNPCTKLPWGRLTAINLNTLEQQFSVVHGPDTNGQHTGGFSVSGPVVTAGGLVFSAGTRGHALYVYDAQTGERVAELPLPGPAQATPMVYESNGKQYVVLCVGGHGPLEMAQGDSVIAFGLP